MSDSEPVIEPSIITKPAVPTSEVDNSVKEILNPRTISKRSDQSGRDETAFRISQFRKESQGIRADIGGRQIRAGEIETQDKSLAAEEEKKLLLLSEKERKLFVQLRDLIKCRIKIS